MRSSDPRTSIDAFAATVAALSRPFTNTEAELAHHGLSAQGWAALVETWTERLARDPETRARFEQAFALGLGRPAEAPDPSVDETLPFVAAAAVAPLPFKAGVFVPPPAAPAIPRASTTEANPDETLAIVVVRPAVDPFKPSGGIP